MHVPLQCALACSWGSYLQATTSYGGIAKQGLPCLQPPLAGCSAHSTPCSSCALKCVTLPAVICLEAVLWTSQALQATFQWPS